MSRFVRVPGREEWINAELVYKVRAYDYQTSSKSPKDYRVQVWYGPGTYIDDDSQPLEKFIFPVAEQRDDFLSGIINE